MAVKYWLGTSVGNEGDVDHDDTPGFVDSNWVNAAGTGVEKPTARKLWCSLALSRKLPESSGLSW